MVSYRTMKNTILLILLSSIILKSQSFTSKDWKVMANELTTTLSFTKSEIQNIKDFSFKAVWDNQLSYSENLGYYGGISELHILKMNNEIQTLYNFEDNIGLGQIDLTFYDYNMDGAIDFSVPIECGKSCYFKYYLFNPKSQKFEHQKEWDYLRIQKINRKKKLIITQPDGSAKTGEQILYRINQDKLMRLKTIKY